MSYFQSQGKVVISDVDTRALVRHIRSKGAMNAIISSEELDVAILAKRLESVPSMDGLELSSKVSCGTKQWRTPKMMIREVYELPCWILE
jgi:carbamoyl-phosphate synthase small subunit